MKLADARAAARDAGARVVSIDDPHYPPLLREIPDPPALLFYRGSLQLLSRGQLAVVGSRRASPAAQRAARMLCQQLVESGLVVTSGLALGIDGVAHRAAIDAGGRSIAVMATGIEQVYPRRHQALAAQLVGAGCLVTEFPPGMPPLPRNFPRRNRIISGLSLGVLVIEAALPSGSLITARTALEQGREVFALPWSILHDGGKGCLQLLRDGAKLVQDVDDVLEELGPLYTLQRQAAEPSTAAPGGGTAGLVDLVGFETVSVDELVRESGITVADLLRELSALELAGLLVRVPGGYIRAR